MIADVCASLSWTWEYADNTLTIRRLMAFRKYWERHPPVHKLVAGFMGYESPAQAQTIDNIEELFTATGTEIPKGFFDG